MSDFSTSQKSYMDELFSKLTNVINAKTTEVKNELTNQITDLKKEIHVSITNYETKIEELEEANRSLKNNIVYLQRKVRKNNLVIFGINNTETNLLNIVTEIFNEQIGVEVLDKDINDVYKIGQKDKEKRPVIVELVSYKKKQLILKNAKKLKGKSISIARDLCFEDQKTQKLLARHLKAAKSSGIQAYLKGDKIVIGNETYTVQDLENDTPYQLRKEEAARPDSAPSTPNPQSRQKRLNTELGLEDEQQKQKKTKTSEKSVTVKPDTNINTYKTRSTSITKY